MYENDQFLEAALKQAKKSLRQGGIPIGAVLVADYSPGQEHSAPTGRIVASGHNQRVQKDDPTAHAEMECIRAAGRRRDWHTLTMYTTLSPCPMCAGTAILLRIPHIIIGENRTFRGDEEHLRRNGIRLTIFNDQRCVDLMRQFIRKNPELWSEDIGVPERRAEE